MPTETPSNRIMTHAQLLAHGGESFARALRIGRPLSVIVLDIDFFKQVNDTWGRETGDSVLKGLSEILDQKVRRLDLVGRIHGDEFGLILLDTEKAGACVVAERLLRTVATTPFPLPEPFGQREDGPLHVTVSVGVADLASGGLSLADLFQQAEQALVAAKKNGRNRVEVFTGEKEN